MDDLDDPWFQPTEPVLTLEFPSLRPHAGWLLVVLGLVLAPLVYAGFVLL